MKDWMTIQDLSEYLQVPESKIRHLMTRALIPYHDKVGSPRFFKQEVDDWMMSDKQQGTSGEASGGTDKEDSFIYRGKPIKDYMLTASMVMLGETAWNRLPGFIKQVVDIANRANRSYLSRTDFKPLANNYNDYLRMACQLGLIDNVREGKRVQYFPTEYSKRLSRETAPRAIKQVILDSILEIVKRGQEAIPQERHAIFLLWYILKIRQRGLEPEENYFNKEGETTSYPEIRLNFSMSLRDFLLGDDRELEKEFLAKWDQFV